MSGFVTDAGRTAQSAPPRMPRPDFDRSPFIVIWETTRSCDLACAHCRAEARSLRDRQELSFAEGVALLEHVRSEFGPVLFVLTGGDPLKRDDLFELVAAGTRMGLRMGVAPSATPLLTETAIGRLKDCGARRLAVSLDGADAARHDAFRGKEKTFQRTVEALQAARAIGLETQINSSMGSDNLHQLEDIYELCLRYQITLWSVFLLVPTGRAGSDMLMRAADHERIYSRLARLALDDRTTFDIKTTAGQPYYRVRSELLAKRGVDLEPGAGFGPGQRMRAPGGVNDGKGFVFIDHRGNIQPSGFLPVTCGNVRKDGLAEVYRKHPVFTALRDPDLYGGKCGVCEYRTLCGGSRSRAYGLTGDYLASDPTCVYLPPQYRS